MAHRVQHRRLGQTLVERQTFPFPFPGPISGRPDDDDDEDEVVTTTRRVIEPEETTTRRTVADGPTAGPIVRPPVNTPEPAPAPVSTSQPAVVQPPVQPTVPAPVVVISTSSTSSIPIATSAVPIPSVNTPPVAVTSTTPRAVVTQISTSSARLPSTTAAAAASGSSSAEPTEAKSNVGTIVGGLAAGVAGVVVVIFIITYILRRKRAAQYEKDAFDAAQFRRSAVLMDDPPTHQDTIDRGFNPPPHMAQYPGPAAVTYGNMGRSDYPGQPGGFGANADNQASGWNDISPPPSAHTGQPLMSSNVAGKGAGGGFGYPEPMPSPVSTHVGPYDSQYSQSNLAREPSMASQNYNVGATIPRAPSAAAVGAFPVVGTALTRDPSIIHQQYNEMPETPGAQYAHYPGIDSNGSPRNSATDYVELSRSSVTPFQAQQYKIISSKLNAPVPQGLATPIAEEEFQKSMSPPPAFPAALTKSPFEDPQDNISVEEFPAPPTPAAQRIVSFPPRLPEINVHSNNQSVSSPTPLDAFVMSGPTSSHGHGSNDTTQTFPTTPSADHSTFGHASFVAPPATSQPPMPTPLVRAEGNANNNSTSKRPDTVYDPEDAYGGM